MTRPKHYKNALILCAMSLLCIAHSKTEIKRLMKGKNLLPLEKALRDQ